MPKLIIKNLLDLDGEYEINTDFTHRDFHTIKQIAGVRANELEDALNAGDADVVVALAAITLRKAGKGDVVNDLLDSQIGSITLVLDEEEPAANPQSAGDGSAHESASDTGQTSSGDDTRNGTAPSPETSNHPVSGIPA